MIINQASLNAIYRSFNTVFKNAFDAAASQYQMICMETISTGKTTLYPWLGAFPAMSQWVGERKLQDLKAQGFEVTNIPYEATVEVDRDSIEDDQVGVYGNMIAGLGFGAKTHPDILAWALLKAGWTTTCYDGQYLFSSSHPVGSSTASNNGAGAGTSWFLADLSRPVKPLILQWRKRPEFVAKDKVTDEDAFMRRSYIYGVDDRKAVAPGLWQLIYGSKDTLSEANYVTARTAMMSYTNDYGVPLGIMPTHLIVPPSLESTARAIVSNQLTTGGASNTWYNTAQLMVVPWLA